MVDAVILAGGRGSRLGGCTKSLLPLGNSTVLAEIIRRLAPQTGALAIAARKEQGEFSGFGLPVLWDRQNDRGPLSGILSALEWAAGHGRREVLTVAGDTPFLPCDLVTRLGRVPACAESNGRIHPLIALWPVSCLTLLRETLEKATVSGDRYGLAVRPFASALGMKTVTFEKTSQDPFFNINTYEDLSRLTEDPRAALTVS